MGNVALHALVTEAGLSNAGLAKAIVTAGAKEGVHLATTATSVKRMLDGAQPRWPVPRLVASVLAQRLQREVGVTECGFADRSPSADTFDGFRCAPTVSGTIAVVAELSGRDIGRRNFLLGSAFAAAAFTEPALFALTIPPPPPDGRRAASAHVEVVLDITRRFEGLHRKFGGGAVRDQVVSFVHQHARAVREASPDDAGRELSRALAQTTSLAGLTTIDSGRHALGQRYYVQALTMARQSGDRLLAANILAEMCRETIDIGNATDDSDGQHATALASAALGAAGNGAPPAFTAWLHTMRSRALTVLGDSAGAIDAIDAAKRAFERSGPGTPDWFGFYREADLLADVGQCLRDAGRPRQGLALLEQNLATLPVTRVTARVKTRVHIATAHVELGDHDSARVVMSDTLTAIAELSSNRTVDRVRTLRRRAMKAPAGPRRTELIDQLTEFLRDQDRAQSVGGPPPSV